MKKTTAILSILAMFLFFVFPKQSTAEKLRHRFVFSDATEKEWSGGYTILIGQKSRKYTESFSVGKNEVLCNLADLPLKVDSPNYICLMIAEDKIYSEEIVVIWSGGKTDSDSDGLSDEMEKKLGTRQDRKDSDNDKIPDGEEYAIWGEKRSMLDFDEDGLPNLLDPDSDGDGILDGHDSEIARIPALVEFPGIQAEMKQLLMPVRKIGDLEEHPGKASFSWHPDPIATFYRIYKRKKGEVYDLTRPTWEGKGERVKERIKATLKDLKLGETYFTACTSCYGGMESDLSVEVEFTLPKEDMSEKNVD